MDRNQFLGALLLSFAVIIYLNYFGPKKKNIEKENTQKNIDISRSISSEKKENITKEINNIQISSDYSIENDFIKVNFSKKSGAISNVFLKNYKFAKNSKIPLNLLNNDSSQIAFILKHLNNKINTFDKYFILHELNKNFIALKLKVNEQDSVIFKYTLKEDYCIDFELELINPSNNFNKENLEFLWKNDLLPLEIDKKKSLEKANINYYLSNNKFKSLKLKTNEKSSITVNENLKWIAFKQKFFTLGIVSKTKFKNTYLQTIPYLEKNSKYLKNAFIKTEIPISNNKVKLRFYFGPNKIKFLKKAGKGFDNNLYLGFPVIKQINKFFIYPVFLFLEKFIKNLGIVIILLVIFIKLVLLPLSLKSHISTAKIKILKPELDKIKEKVGNDKQKLQLAQVALYKEMGVNPLSGCLPILLQMPVLFAMFNFFPNIIELRQASFLWVKDLSTYDSILKLPFTIPIYGDHVSLFTLLMTITSVISTFFSGQNTNNNSDPSMKMFTFMMPLMFMAIFNSHPAALSYYYFITNLLTILQQVIINKFIDEEDLKKQLEENRKQRSTENLKPRTFSRLEKLLEKKNKNKK